jgi:biopolymer transport protein ExbD
MKIRRRNKLLVESPASAASDIAFILIIFFLVCASVQPETGKKQSLPKSEDQPDKKQQSENPEVAISRTSVILNGNPMQPKKFKSEIKRVLAQKKREVDKVVVVKSKPDTPYEIWIEVAAYIKDAGGIITLQLEEQQTEMVN